MLHTQLAALALAATALTVSGCGGSSKTTATTLAVTGSTSTATTSANTTPASSTPVKPASGTALTRAELIAKADAICARVNAKRAATTINTLQAYATVMPSVAAFEQTGLAEMAKLVPPTSLASDWQEILAGNQTLAENTEKVAEYAKANNLKGVNGFIVAATQAQDQVTVVAKKDGFKSCAKFS